MYIQVLAGGVGKKCAEVIKITKPSYEQVYTTTNNNVKIEESGDTVTATALITMAGGDNVREWELTQEQKDKAFAWSTMTPDMTLTLGYVDGAGDPTYCEPATKGRWYPGLRLERSTSSVAPPLLLTRARPIPGQVAVLRLLACLPVHRLEIVGGPTRGRASAVGGPPHVAKLWGLALAEPSVAKTSIGPTHVLCCQLASTCARLLQSLLRRWLSTLCLTWRHIDTILSKLVMCSPT